MVAPVSINSAQTLPQEELEQAQLLSDLIRRVDRSTLYVVRKIFADGQDRRVKRGGLLFLACLLRMSIVVQITLWDGTEICDAARIDIPNVYKLWEKRKVTGWKWCYDTTSKYLKLLVAAGVLITAEQVTEEKRRTKKGERGVYYLPLGNYAFRPEYAKGQLEKLATKRPKVSKSMAFRRTAEHTSVEALMATLGPEKSFNEEAAQALIEDVIQTLQKSGKKFTPVERIGLLRVLVEHAPRVYNGEEKHLFTVETGRLEHTENEPGGVPAFRIKDTTHQNGKDKAAQTPITVPAHPVPSFSQENMLVWRFSFEERQGIREEIQSEELVLPALLTLFFEQNGSRLDHYKKLLEEQQHQVLDLAIIDSLIRSEFPDRPPRDGIKKPLGGGWVTKKKDDFLAGEQPLKEVVAWASTPYTYEEIWLLFHWAAQRQSTRPLPEELIVDHEEVADLLRQNDHIHCLTQDGEDSAAQHESDWEYSVAETLEAKGYLCVDIGNDLTPCQSYQNWLLNIKMTEANWQLENTTFLDQMGEWREKTIKLLDAKLAEEWTSNHLARVERTLDNLPDDVQEKLQRSIDLIEPALSPTENIQVLLVPEPHPKKGTWWRPVLKIEDWKDLPPWSSPPPGILLTEPDQIFHFVAQRELDRKRKNGAI